MSLAPTIGGSACSWKKIKTFERSGDGAIYDSEAGDERNSCQRGELIIICIFRCYAAVFLKYGATLLMFNRSDLVPRWTLIVPFVWTVDIVQGSRWNLLSDLRRIPSFEEVLCHQLYNPSPEVNCFHAVYCNQFGAAYISQFCSSRQGRVCRTTCPYQQLLRLKRL